MSEEWNQGYDAGVQWAKANWYNSPVGKNCDGGVLGAKLASLPVLYARGFAEGVRYALGNPNNV